jgi:hypothetical protein
MDLSDALRVIERSHRFGDLYLQADHICAFQPPHTLPCSHYPDSAVYTGLDTILDSPDRLAARLARGGSLKP